jgi:hypothetical protein
VAAVVGGTAATSEEKEDPHENPLFSIIYGAGFSLHTSQKAEYFVRSNSRVYEQIAYAIADRTF